MGLLTRLVLKTAVNGVALWVAGLLINGIVFNDSTQWTGTLVTIVLVALVFGLVNAVIKPIVKLFSLPLIWLTLGLFTLVINALMLELTSWLAGHLGLGFHVQQFFWDAVLGAVVVTIVSMVLNVVVPDGKD